MVLPNHTQRGVRPKIECMETQQMQEVNLGLRSTFQAGPGLKLCLDMDMAVETTEDMISMTDESLQFCMIFHLKGV